MTELGRTKKALEIAKNHFTAQCALGHLAGGARVEVERVLALIQDTLNPPPEYEEAKVVRWMMKDDPDTIHDTPQFHVDNYVRLTGTFKRPKPQPVQKSETVDAVIGFKGRAYLIDESHACARFTPPKGTKGTLTFTWTE